MAAVELDQYFPFDAGDGADVLEDDWRKMARHWLTSGPIRNELNSFHVVPTTGRNVTIGSGRAWINGHYGELASDATIAIPTNSSGNSRIDRVVLRVDFTDNKIYYDVVAGTPAGSPAAPTITQNTSVWEISLAQLFLVNGFSSIAGGDIFDERRYASGKPPGGPFLIACAATLDTPNVVTIATWENVNFDGADEYDTAALHNPSSNSERFTVSGGCAGIWAFSCVTSWQVTSHLRHALRILKNGSVIKTFGFTTAPEETADADNLTDFGYYEGFFSAADLITWQVRWDSADGETDPVSIIAARATARYVGSLDG